MSDIRYNGWLHRSGTGGVWQDSSGRVGIGTSVGMNCLINSGPNALTFGTGATPAERLRITSAGVIGLGIASPVSTTKLHISKGWNNSTATTSSAVNLLISNNASAGDWSVLGFQAGNTGGSAIYFGDTDSTNAGFIDYYHSDILSKLQNQIGHH